MKFHFSHPDETNKILTVLYLGPKRSSELTKSIDSVSEPTKYSILKELEEMEFIHKDEKGPRNVIYSIKETGSKFFEEECSKAQSTLHELVRNTPYQKQILIDVLVDNLIEKVPNGWKSAAKKEIIKKYIAKDLEGQPDRIFGILNSRDEVESA